MNLLRLNDLIVTAFNIFSKRGFRYLLNLCLSRLLKINPPNAQNDSKSYRNWLKKYDLALNIVKSKSCPESTTITFTFILDPDTNVFDAAKTIQSLKEQHWHSWELLLITTSASTNDFEDTRIKIAKISAGSSTFSSLISKIQGNFVSFLEAGDLLSPYALNLVAAEISNFTCKKVIYTDHDYIDRRGRRYSPFFKPDWNPDMALSMNYLRPLMFSWPDVLESLEIQLMPLSEFATLAALHCCFETLPENIHHIPVVLCHSTRSSKNLSYCDSVNRFLNRRGVQAETRPGMEPGTCRVLYSLPSEPPLVSLIIPTRDGHLILKRCIDSIVSKTTYPSYEIIVVDNQSSDTRTLSYLSEISAAGVARVIKFDATFNYSAINNLAVTQARGTVIGLLNNDTEVISPDWLTEMVSNALRPDIGAVGALLLYPNDLVQHGGVIGGIGECAGHSHKYGRPPGYFGRLGVAQEVLAVTAACLVVRKKVYEEVDGLNEEHLAIAFNDLDFCLKIREAGYRNLWTPYAELYHHESVSRGLEDTPEKKARFEREKAYIRHKWAHIIDNDPFYNPNLTLEWEDFSLAWPPRLQKNWYIKEAS